MRFGAMNFPVRPVLSEIESLGGLGMDYIELAMDPPLAHHNTLREQKQQIRKLLRDKGLGLVCHLPTFVHTADLTDGIRRASLEETLGALQTAAELGAEKVVCHPSYIGGLAVFVIEQAKSLAMDAFAQVARRAAELDITVCVENMLPKSAAFVEPEDFAPVFQQFPHFRWVFDVGHAHLNDTAKDRSNRFFRSYGNRLEHVHISDNRGRLDDHLPVGRGTVNFDTLADELCRLQYDGTFTLEIFTQDRQDLVRSRNKLVALFDRARAKKALT